MDQVETKTSPRPLVDPKQNQDTPSYLDIVYQDHAKHRDQVKAPARQNDMYMPAEYMYQQPGQTAGNAKPLSYMGTQIAPNLEDGDDGMPVAVYKMPPMPVNDALT